MEWPSVYYLQICSSCVLWHFLGGGACPPPTSTHENLPNLSASKLPMGQICKINFSWILSVLHYVMWTFPDNGVYIFIRVGSYIREQGFAVVNILRKSLLYSTRCSDLQVIPCLITGMLSECVYYCGMPGPPWCGKLSERSDRQTHGPIRVTSMSPAGVFGLVKSMFF